MSEHRILLIESPANLSVDLQRIKIRRDGFDDYFVSPKDIAVICLHHHSIQISVQALRHLSESGASVLVTDEVHNPCAWLLPQVGNGNMVRRLRQQIILDTSDLKAKLWQEIVQVRLRTQSLNLRCLNRKGALRLDRLAEEVQLGDHTKCEGQGAKHYWKHLFNDDFLRVKQGANDVTNARLNYGYSILRSMIARTIVMAGLNPCLGLGHHSTENPFNLVDDFIEMYRFLVERHVYENFVDEFDGLARKNILQFVKQEVTLNNGMTYRLPNAVSESVASFVRILDERSKQLTFPVDLITVCSDDK
jgi:CRISPR-associated protein Cas1